MRRVSFAVSLASILLAACGGPASQPSQELPALDKAWEDAVNARDLDGLVALYTEDARVMPPNAEMVQGQDGVREVFGAMIAAGGETELESIAAVVAGDIGYGVGNYVSKTTGGEVVDRGSYVEVFRKVNGEWKISNDIWNSSMPAGAAGTTILGTHEVEDASRWLSAWQKGPGSRHELFAQHGAPDVRVFQSMEDPNLTGLVINVTDLEALQAFLDSPEGDAAKAEDSVKVDTIRLFREVK